MMMMMFVTSPCCSRRADVRVAPQSSPSRNRLARYSLRSRKSRHVVECCASEEGSMSGSEEAGGGKTSSCLELTVPLLRASMTSGGDVLFPGCAAELSLAAPKDRHAVRKALCETSQLGVEGLVAVCAEDAWGGLASAGTLAIICNAKLSGEHDLEKETTNENAAQLLSKNTTSEESSASSSWCSLLGCMRLRVLEISTEREDGGGDEDDHDFHMARVSLFCDDPPLVSNPSQSRRNSTEEVERTLLEALSECLRLLIKLSSASSDAHRRAVLERAQFCVQTFSDGKLPAELEHQLQQLEQPTSNNFRRELVSFVACDLLDLPFMQRKAILDDTDTLRRSLMALELLEPFVKQLAAKSALSSALGGS